ncbi:MAG: 3-isopropylmalate dehydratase small subunit [Lactobacillales bacterium]|nr:3-isopropylmalate dehydratase small subunit [Lactobacillales bacterium]
MEKFTIYTGTSVPIMNDNIDTDILIPKTYLANVTKEGYGKNLFDEWRYLETGAANPDFVLNKPEYANATILVAGDNFGCGSSREHAAWALLDYGFKVIIAGGFSDIHYMNELKNGLLPIVLPHAARVELSQIAPTEEVTIDLPSQTVSAAGITYHFEINEMWKEKLINGLDDIGITLQHEAELASYEENKIPEFWR